MFSYRASKLSIISRFSSFSSVSSNPRVSSSFLNKGIQTTTKVSDCHRQYHTG